MGVPTDENTEFKIFGPTNGSDTTTIQGAIDQGNNGVVDGDTKFSELIAASIPSKFDPIYAGQIITNTNQVTCAEQFRGYPSTSGSTGASNFGSGNLIGHYGTTGFSTLSWEVIVNFTGYSEKTVTIGPSAACLHGCSYTSASRVSNSSLINGSGTIRVKRLTDSSSNSNTAVNDDGDVQLSVVGGTIASATGLSRSNNNTVGSFGFSAGETFDKTFTVSGLTVAAGDTFQLDITEG